MVIGVDVCISDKHNKVKFTIYVVFCWFHLCVCVCVCVCVCFIVGFCFWFWRFEWFCGVFFFSSFVLIAFRFSLSEPYF